MANSLAEFMSIYNMHDAKEVCTLCHGAAPRPVLICFECGEGVDCEGRPCYTKYCSSGCRIKNCDNHVNDCKDQNVRKAVYRAGELLQAFFFQFRRITFDMKFASIEKRDNVLIVQDGIYGEQEGPLYDFPDEKVKPGNDAMALLSFAACTEVGSSLQTAIQIMLKDITTSIEEAVVKIDPRYSIVQRLNEYGQPFDYELLHQVISIDALDGNSYIIDVAGAQFNHFKPVMVLREYLVQMDPQIRRMSRHGAARLEHIRDIKEDSEDEFCDARPEWVQYHMATAIDVIIQDWERTEEQSLSELLAMDRRSYEKCKETLLDKMSKGLKECLHTLMAKLVSSGGDWWEAFRSLPAVDYGAIESSKINCRLSLDPQGSELYKTWVEQEIAYVKNNRPLQWKKVFWPALASGKYVHYDRRLTFGEKL